MSRRMIDPSIVIKSQVVDDKYVVDLNEILEKYGSQSVNGKSVTLQFYSQEVADDDSNSIVDDTSVRCHMMANTAITISKDFGGDVFIRGLLVDDLNDMNFLPYIIVPDGEYENGITLTNTYLFDVHVIKV